MEMFWWIVGILWIIGWVREMALASSRMRKLGVSFPNDGVKYAMPVMLFVMWPYFYFYGKL